MNNIFMVSCEMHGNRSNSIEFERIMHTKGTIVVRHQRGHQWTNKKGNLQNVMESWKAVC